MSTVVKSNSKSFADYRVESGACRPSSAKTWKNLGYKTIENCHTSCENTDGCMGFDVARPRIRAKIPPDQFACYLHFGNNMKGNTNQAGCRKQNDCSCYIKGASNRDTLMPEPSVPVVAPSSMPASNSEIGGYIRNPGICTPGWWTGPGPRDPHDNSNPVQILYNTSANACSVLCNEKERCMGFDLVGLKKNQDGIERGTCLLHNYKNDALTNLKPIPYQYCSSNLSDCRCYIKNAYYDKDNSYEEIRRNQ